MQYAYIARINKEQSSLTQIFEVFERLFSVTVEYGASESEERQAVDLLVDGVARLVDAHDDGAPLLRQSVGEKIADTDLKMNRSVTCVAEKQRRSLCWRPNQSSVRRETRDSGKL